MKHLKVLSWRPTLPTNLSKNTESYKFSMFSSNSSPKNDFTTVLPAILLLNSIELIVRGEVLFESETISLRFCSTMAIILGTKV